MTAESVAESNQSLAEKASNFEEANNIPKLQSGELTTSGDELVPKVRKPYTITKQRERWTEEEHQKFLEALKLYGRAWRRIEEHIGTKTTVQIRSHAQKFFSKLEREQAGGMLSGKAQDIGIPPPRPKRKPSHPYPRKAAMEDNVSSQTVLSSAPVSPTICEGAMKPAAFGPYVSPRPRNVQLEIATMGKSLGGSQAELKLFGQTVVVPTATRAVPVGKGIGKQAVVDPEGFDLLEQSQRNVEAEQAPFAIASACSSEITMLESKNDSLNRQRGDATEVRDCATNTELKRAAYHENPVPPLMHQFGNELRKLFATATLNMPMTGQHSPMDLALYYSRFMEGLQGANTTTPFCNLGLDGAWQPGSSNACIYAAAMAALWPNLSGASLSEMTSSVLRSMLTGVSSDTYKAENQIDALAAASAWWTLQGFIRRGFLAQHMGSVLETAASLGVNLQLTMKRQDSSLQNDKRQDGQEGENMTMNVCDTVEGDDTLALLKDSTHGTSKRTLISNFEGLDGGKRRVRSRSVSGYNDPCEKNGPDSRPPSSSGSGDASGSCETMHQPNGDDASGNSGPSSNSSRCGIPQVTGKGFIPTDGSSFDKDSTAEATTEKELNAVKTPSLQHASSCSNKARPQHPRGQKVARPSRSGGSDGEQRKEVSQEGRMAFQALFAHEKLPQTFFRGRNREFTDEDCTTRAPHPSDESVTSDLESVCQFQIPLVSGRSSSFSIPVKGSLDKYTEQISRVESMASGTGPITGECSNWEDGGKVLEKVGSDASAFSVSSSSLSRSGFVPYCRAEVRANPTRSKEFKRSCGLEADDQFRDGNRCLEEEVKQS